jgi:DNA-directed RNA polymerase specialized sigma subunit
MTIPVSDVARRLVRDLNADLSKVDHSWTHAAVEHLRSTLGAEQVSEDKISSTQPSSEKLYEDQEFAKELDKIINQTLTSDEQMYIYMRFEEGMTLAEIADFFGLAGKTSAVEREKRLICKLHDLVSKIQQ